MRVFNILIRLKYSRTINFIFEQHCPAKKAKKAQNMTSSSSKKHRAATMKNVTEGESMPTFIPKDLIIYKESRSRLKPTPKSNLLSANQWNNLYVKLLT